VFRVRFASYPERLISCIPSFAPRSSPTRLRGMQAALTSYLLLGIDAVPVDVVMDNDRARVVETSRCLHSFRFETTGSVASAISHVVNAYTRPDRNRAPARLITICR